MDAKKYQVTCLSCNGSSKINIMNGQSVMYIDHTPIIACRLRGDMEWGFQCICGNDSRLAASERDQASTLVQATSPTTLQRILDGLSVKDSLKFKMELA